MHLNNSLLGALLGAGLAAAHMEMTYPPPFRSKFNDLVDSPDSDMVAPLDGSGSDYPCKGYHEDLGTPAGASVASWAPGSSQKMSITGGAFHGGGSCQASLSYDKGKTFTVIHSFVGSCPMQGDSSFPFKVPSDAPTGEAVFAWTWFNQIGNREMYMNCAAVTIGDGKKASKKAKRDAIAARKDGAGFSSRPEIFVANTGTGCKTADSMDVVFPDPGPDVTEATSKSAEPVGTCGGGSGGGAGSGGSTPPSGGEGGNDGSAPPAGGNDGSAPPADGSSPPPSGGEGGNGGSTGGGDNGSGETNPGIPDPNAPNPGIPNQSSAPASGTPTGTPEKQPQPPAIEQPAPTGTAPGGVFITKPASDTAPAPTGDAPAPVPEEPSNTLTTVITPPAGPIATPPAGGDDAPEVPVDDEPAAPVPTPEQPSSPEQPSTPAPGGDAGGKTPGEKCDNEGDWNCIGGKAFQRCASGQWSVVMQMAAGTTCQEGMSAQLASTKRGFRFRRAI